MGASRWTAPRRVPWLPWVVAGLACVALTATADQALAQARPPVSTAEPAPVLPASDLLLRSALAAIGRNDQAQVDRLLAAVLADGTGPDPWTRGQALRIRGLAALAGGRFGEASAALAEAEALFASVGAEAQLALTWRLRARVAVQDGNRPLARQLAERALAVFEARRDDTEIVATLAVLSTLLERADGGVDVLTRALSIAERLGDEDQLARLLHTHGDWRFDEGDFAGASRSYERAESLYARREDDEGLGRIWTSLGRLNRAHGRHEEALVYFRRAYTALARAGDRQGVIQAVNATATALGNLGRDDEARAEYERALALARETGAARIVNFQRGNLGGHYLGQGDYVRAIDLLAESAAQESNPTTRAIRLTQFGRALTGAGRHEDAVARLGEAIDVLREVGNRERLFGALAYRAEAYRAMERREEALADVRASLEVLEEVRRRLAPGDFLRRGFHQYTQEYASLGIRILVEAGRAREALEVAERARARAFLDLLSARPGLAADVDVSATDLLLTTDRLVPALPRADASTARSTSPTAAAATFDGISTEARARRSTIVSYWVEGTRTHIWVVRPDGTFRHASVDVTSRDLVTLVRALWAGLASGPALTSDATITQRTRARGDAAPRATAPAVDGGIGVPLSPRRAARELYRLLVAPIAASLPADGAILTIVPHGPLFRLSFAALLDDDDRYLVERYAVAYGPSVSVLSFTRSMAARRATRPPHQLFVADPHPMPAVPGDAEALPPLPGTVDEVRQIAARLPASTHRTLVGPAAGEAAVTRALTEATTIHFATHGIVRDDDPFGSFLALGGGGPGASEDGALTAEEVYGLRLQARLVVMSACRSGLGEVSADGIVGLTRAFFFAGAPSVVATLWDVADGPSTHLLRDVYAALGRDGNVARALRAAQLGMLADLRAGRIRAGAGSGARLPERPVFWAPFVLVGEP